MASGAPQASNRYVGLRPFEREDSLCFFGRREQTEELLAALDRTHFLSVVGSSGCGKSSLIRAGLIPELLGGFLVEERDRWLFAVTKPGDSPLRNLAAALVETAGGGESSPAEVQALADAIAQLHTAAVVDYLGPVLGEDGNLLLVVDQFEEIFSFRGLEDEERLAGLSAKQRRDRAQRRAVAADFADLLIRLGDRTDLPVYVVLTMRTDFLGDCDVFYGLPEAMNRGRYLVPRLTRQQLRLAIEGPARLSGVEIEARLVDLLLNELGDRTDRLPVLQHALYRTWEKWQNDGGNGKVDLKHYRDAGGLEEALQRHAQEALAECESEVKECDREVVARIFKCLTETDASHRRVRRPAAISEIAAVSGVSRPVVEETLERFRAGGRSFVLFSEGAEAGDPRVDISHESLIRQWDLLREWVDKERDSRDRFLDLVRDARREAGGERGLLQDPELQVMLDWRDEALPTAEWADRYSRNEDDFEVATSYLDRSQEMFGREAQRRRRRRQLVRWAVGVGVVLALTILSLYAELSRREARDQARVAVAGEWIDKDPMRAALTLLEVRNPDRTLYAIARMREALSRWPAVAALRGHEKEIFWAEFSPDGQRVATASFDGTARVWKADGTGEPTVLRGHQGRLYWVAFSPDGQRLVTASADGTARVWSADGAGEPIVLRGHQDEVARAEFSPDGRGIVTVSDDRTARLWQADGSGAPIVLAGHEDVVRTVAFSPDGRRIVTTSYDKTARVWRADRRSEPVVLRGHEDVVNEAVFSPDGRWIATASSDGTARVWRADGTGSPVVLRGHGDRVWWAEFSPDGRRIVTASVDRTARVWRADGTGEPVVLDGHGDIVARAIFSADGARILTASYDGTARLWSLGDDSAVEVAVLRGHEALVSRAVFSPDGARILTASFDGTARLWSAEPVAEPVVLRGHEGALPWAALSPDGRRTVTASVDRTARVWTTDGTGEPVVLEGHEALVARAAFSPDGARILTASFDGTARVWQADGTGERIDLEGHGGQVLWAAFSPDGQRIVTASFDWTARVWNADGTGEPVVLEGHEAPVDRAFFSPDGERIVTASDDGTARVWQADGTGEPVVLAGHEDKVLWAVFSPDGERVVTASDDGTARVWRSDGMGDPVILRGHEDKVRTATFSSDGRRIVTASYDKTARVWRADGKDEPVVLRGHEDVVNDAAFSGDGRRIVTASSDKTARVWQADGTGEPVVLRGHEGQVWRASFGRHGERVVTASEDGTARIWRVSGGVLQDLIRSTISGCLEPGFRQRYFGESKERARRESSACER